MIKKKNLPELGSQRGVLQRYTVEQTEALLHFFFFKKKKKNHLIGLKREERGDNVEKEGQVIKETPMSCGECGVGTSYNIQNDGAIFNTCFYSSFSSSSFSVVYNGVKCRYICSLFLLLLVEWGVYREEERGGGESSS